MRSETTETRPNFVCLDVTTIAQTSVYMLSADKGNDYGRNMCCTSLCAALATFLYISLEKTRLPVLSDPR